MSLGDGKDNKTPALSSDPAVVSALVSEYTRVSIGLVALALSTIFIYAIQRPGIHPFHIFHENSVVHNLWLKQSE
jgi:hypothetical protein